MQCLPAYSWQRLVLALSFLRALAQRAERERRRTIREKEGGKEEDGRRILAQSENERYSGSSPASQPALEKRETVIRKMRGGEWWRVRRKKGEKERKEKYIRKRAQRRRAVQYMSSSLGSPKVAYLSSSGFFASRARARLSSFLLPAPRVLPVGRYIRPERWIRRALSLLLARAIPLAAFRRPKQIFGASPLKIRRGDPPPPAFLLSYFALPTFVCTAPFRLWMLYIPPQWLSGARIWTRRG